MNAELHEQQRRLTEESRNLFRALWHARKAAREAGDGERVLRLDRLLNAAVRRDNRRRMNLRQLATGRPIITVPALRTYMRRRLEAHRGRGGVVDANRLAMDAAAYFDAGMAVPPAIYAVADAVVAADLEEQAKRQYSRQFFVEKPIRYEPDGDVLWA